MPAGTAVLIGAATLGALLASASVHARGSPRAWSDPTVLAECALAGGPQVAFPSEGPSTPTGAGAIVWASDPSPCGSPSASSTGASWGLSVAALESTDRAQLAGTQPLARWSGTGLAAVGASFGRVAVAAAVQPSGASGAGATVVLQGGATVARRGRASQPLGLASSLPGSESESAFALTRAYLGDVAIAAVVPGPAIAVRVERFFQRGFGPVRLIPIHAGRVTALTVAMDYRAEVLLAWQQSGAIYSHLLRRTGPAEPTQRLGVSDPDPQLQALLSDDDRGMIAWSSTDIRTRSTARTRVYLDRSAPGVRFVAPPELLASFPDPQHAGERPGSVALVRLASENVVLVWTAAEDGHYVVRAVPAAYGTTRPSVRVSEAHAQAVLGALAAGPAGEAVALWTSAPLVDGVLDPDRTELWAARMFIGADDRLGLQAPEMIAAAGANVFPSVAVDPANDRAVAAWRTLGAHPSIEYAVSAGAAGYSRRSPAAALAPLGGGTHRLRIAAAVAGALALLALAGWRLRLRSRVRLRSRRRLRSRQRGEP